MVERLRRPLRGLSVSIWGPRFLALAHEARGWAARFAGWRSPAHAAKDSLAGSGGATARDTKSQTVSLLVGTLSQRLLGHALSHWANPEPPLTGLPPRATVFRVQA